MVSGLVVGAPSPGIAHVLYGVGVPGAAVADLNDPCVQQVKVVDDATDRTAIRASNSHGVFVEMADALMVIGPVIAILVPTPL